MSGCVGVSMMTSREASLGRAAYHIFTLNITATPFKFGWTCFLLRK